MRKNFPSHSDNDLLSKIPSLLDSWVFRVANSYRIRKESAQGIVAGAFAIILFCHIEEILNDVLREVAKLPSDRMRASLRDEVSQRLGSLRYHDLSLIGYWQVIDLWARPVSEVCDLDLNRARKAVDASFYLTLCRHSMVLSEKVVELAYLFECGHLPRIRDQFISSLAPRRCSGQKAKARQ